MVTEHGSMYSSAAYVVLVIAFGTVLHPELKAFYRHGHGSRLEEWLKDGHIGSLQAVNRLFPVASWKCWLTRTHLSRSPPRFCPHFLRLEPVDPVDSLEVCCAPRLADPTNPFRQEDQTL